MADISGKVTRKSIKAKKKAAIKTIKLQAKESIKKVKIEYDENPMRKMAKEHEKQQKIERRVQRANARLAYNIRQPRQFTLGEDLLNSISHGIGAGLSVAAIVLLVLKALKACPEGVSLTSCVTSYVMFGASMFIMYLMSTLYHAIPSMAVRRVFSVFSHCSIYFLIAGTYSPFVIVNVPGKTGVILNAVIWTICAVMIFFYIVLGPRMRNFSVFTYIVLGWLIVSTFSFFPVGVTLPLITRSMLFTGGAVFTFALIFFLMRRHKWTHSIFHLLTLFGSVFHFFSIYFMI